ncbi:MAG: hypothetical protein KGL39_48440 [Patescibacteria group bacterium]|nr:hypothetical protein [Patescibacteria group bacterium]
MNNNIVIEYTQSKNIEIWLTKWISLLDGGFSKIKKGCEELVEMVAKCPDIFDRIVAHDRRFTYNILGSMFRVGKGEMIIELLFDPSQNGRDLSKLPSHIQKQIYTEPVKIVRQIADKCIVEEKPFRELSRNELLTAVDLKTKRVRPIEEQIKMVNVPVASKRKEKYIIEPDGSVVHVLQSTDLTREHIQSILNKMNQLSAVFHSRNIA